MKNTYIYSITVCALLALAGCGTPKQESFREMAQRVFSLAEEKYADMAQLIPEGMQPRSAKGDSLICDDMYWWCSGFYGGTLWYIYEYGHAEQIKALAEKYTWDIEDIKTKATNHDIGFQINCTFGNALRLTGDKRYMEPLLTAAQTLADRFNPTVGCTLSWPQNDRRHYPVIIDNMMNLELLMTATALGGDEKYAKIANTHAYVTMANHFREDWSSFHLVDYEPSDGSVRYRCTAQGYSDDSAWARGNAWGLYGFTMMYELAKDPVYLVQAEHIADYLLGRLPEDGIPYWDFDAPEIPNALRDASAGAIMASALIRLSEFTLDAELSARCIAAAQKQLRTLASDEYLSPRGSDAGFLLRHSVGNIPSNSEVDVPLTYADYYFVEAILRMLRHEQGVIK